MPVDFGDILARATGLAKNKAGITPRLPNPIRLLLAACGNWRVPRPAQPGDVGRHYSAGARGRARVADKLGGVSLLGGLVTKCGYNARPIPYRRYAAMGLLHHLETQLERQIPAQLQARPPTSPGRLPAPLRPLPLGHASPPSLRPRHCHQLRRSLLANPRVPLRPVSSYDWRHDAAGR